jgi:hypothetical protein
MTEAAVDRSVRVAPLAAFALLCALGIAATVAYLAPDLTFPADRLFGDFRVTLYEPGQALLDGRDPIREVDSSYNGGIYPPITVALTLPLAALPFSVAAAIWLGALVGGILGALYLCGVRDWRCYGLALASPPVIAGLAYGNVSMLLVFGLACAWVYRDRQWRSGLIVGLLVATRLFPWPLVVWLLLTRRIRAAAVAAASSMVFSLLGWALISFDRIGEFPAVTRSNADKFVDDGGGVASIVANLGGTTSAISIALVVSCAGALLLAARHRHDDLASLGWAIAAALFATPIVWCHYYALMLVPLALSSPHLSRRWLLPYLTAPQLTGTFEAGEKIRDALTGVLFTCLAAWRAAHPSAYGRPVRRWLELPALLRPRRGT